MLLLILAFIFYLMSGLVALSVLCWDSLVAVNDLGDIEYKGKTYDLIMCLVIASI